MLSHYISRILLCRIIFDYRQLVCKPRNDTHPRAVIVGPINSFLKPMFYIIIFSTFDILALIIQAIGGAGASQAEIDGRSTLGPTHIMVSEICMPILLIGSGYLCPSSGQHRLYMFRIDFTLPHPQELAYTGNPFTISKNKGL